MKSFMVLARRLLPMLPIAACLAILAATLFGCSGLPGYLADQCSQLRIAYVYALLFLLCPLLILRSRTGIILGAFTLCLNLAFMAPFYLRAKGSSDADAATTKRDIEIVTINIYGAHNNQYAKVVDFVREKHPDVLCLNEITKTWLKKLNTDLPEYTYRFDEGISGGSAIYSRVPIEQVKAKDAPYVRRFGVRGTLAIDGQEVLLISEHPPAPTNAHNWKRRNAELNRLHNEAKNPGQPLILIGDLNSTPWSQYFGALVNEGEWRDSEMGHGIQPSWNALMAVPPMVPIDHCLTSNQFTVMQRSLGPNVGSDHLPVYVKLRLSKAQSRLSS